ncbi:DUF397 domain-containing protein [Nocardia huaxiensis]|uniref:DUF397 domain-containing protein n=1 Tax=Nocardia huaxiensis TaxID=2755382 RepID=A0A7D6ZHL1_9NOCA|nr:DUF397 domain-containing protein [Nocardia huaxiensis]QLY28163.1 DUF397 domain-containing protein [Nocardia huaxiensis]
MTHDAPTGEWFKSSWSEASNACVEVRFDEGSVRVRDSKRPGGPELRFDSHAWDSFLASGVWRR